MAQPPQPPPLLHPHIIGPEGRIRVHGGRGRRHRSDRLPDPSPSPPCPTPRRLGPPSLALGFLSAPLGCPTGPPLDGPPPGPSIAYPDPSTPAPREPAGWSPPHPTAAGMHRGGGGTAAGRCPPSAPPLPPLPPPPRRTGRPLRRAPGPSGCPSGRRTGTPAKRRWRRRTTRGKGTTRGATGSARWGRATAGAIPSHAPSGPWEDAVPPSLGGRGRGHCDPVWSKLSQLEATRQKERLPLVVPKSVSFVSWTVAASQPTHPPPPIPHPPPAIHPPPRPLGPRTGTCTSSPRSPARSSARSAAPRGPPAADGLRPGSIRQEPTRAPGLEEHRGPSGRADRGHFFYRTILSSPKPLHRTCH